MSDNLYVLSDEYLYPEIDLKHAPVELGVSARSIAETVRSGIPSRKSKYDRNDKVDKLYRAWSESSGDTSRGRYEKVLLHLYELYRPKIMAIVRKYRALSPVFDDEDLQQTALFAVFQALVKYDHAEHIDMRFSTYLEWSIRNTFQRTIGYADKFVEVYDEDNNLLCTMSYQKFLARKKVLADHGHRHIVRSRQCYLSDAFHFSDEPIDAAAPPAHRDCAEGAGLPDWLSGRLSPVISNA